MITLDCFNEGHQAFVTITNAVARNGNIQYIADCFVGPNASFQIVNKPSKQELREGKENYRELFR